MDDKIKKLITNRVSCVTSFDIDEEIDDGSRSVRLDVALIVFKLGET